MIAAIIYILAVIGALVVALLTWTVLDPHQHRCRCGNAWRHCGLWSGQGESSLRSVRRHTCGRCGALQWRSNVRWWSP